jgi:hypothetical protein
MVLMTYEPLGLRHINGTCTPRSAAHSWPIGLGQSARTSGRRYTKGRTKPQATVARGRHSQNDGAWDHRGPMLSITVNTRQSGNPGAHESWDHRGPNVVSHGKYETVRQTRAP